MITIRDIRTIVTAPRGTELVVVKVETSEPGLYGVGCATFTQRWSAVVTAVNDFLKPLLVRKAVNQNDLLAVHDELFVLAEWPRSEQRDIRRGRSSVGYQGKDGGNARI